MTSYPRFADSSDAPGGSARFFSGFTIVRRDPVLRVVMFVLWSFSFCSLTFVVFLPEHAVTNLGISVKSTAYGVLYGVFGLGATAGALGVGSLFARIDKARLVRIGMGAFAGLLAVFALVRSPAPAYPGSTVLLGG